MVKGVLKMRAIIVGAGHWHAPWHAAALRARSVDLAGVWDHDPAAARSRAEQWNSTAWASVSDLIAAHADVAVLSPRAVDAPELLEQLIEARIPVIAEKPLGLSADAVEELARRAHDARLFVAVTFVNRFSPVWQFDDDSTVVAAAFRIVNGTPQRYVDDGVGWVVDPLLSGGGALRNLGIHGADAVCALAGDEQLTVESAQLFRAPQWQVETHAMATIRSSAGWVATIEAGFTNPDRSGSDFEWRMARHDSYIVDRDTVVTFSTGSGTRTQTPPTSAERYDAFIGRALDDLAAGRPPLAGLSDAAKAARLVDEIYAHADAHAHVAEATTINRGAL
jgi:predicted dehydrogenase